LVERQKRGEINVGDPSKAQGNYRKEWENPRSTRRPKATTVLVWGRGGARGGVTKREQNANIGTEKRNGQNRRKSGYTHFYSEEGTQEDRKKGSEPGYKKNLGHGEGKTGPEGA